jgi:multidrug resistance efflux pump
MNANLVRASSPDLGQGRTKSDKAGGWIGLKRGIALTVAIALASLILTSALPPLVADQSDRAVINAPVTLLTAPIAGEVKTLSVTPGAEVQDATRVADIVNGRVDRSTLITLEGQRSDAEGRLQATRAKREGDTRFIAQLTADIARQTAALDGRYSEQIVELEAQIGSATASVEEKRQVFSRQNDLVSRSVVAPDMVKAASQQFSGAKFQKESVQSKLAQKRAQLESIRHGVFVGDDVHDISVMLQKKRDMELDVERLTIEEKQTATEVAIRTRLSDAERARLESIEHSTVDAPGAGEVLSVGATVGRHVTAGDTLARMVDCDASFVVAIFSYRKGSDLTPGTRVSIDAGPSGMTGGVITEVLPKTSDKVDESYAVPFPQTERRELYVLVKPDSPLRSAGEDGSRGRCDVGRWVTVARGGGWIPSTSVLWREASRAFSWTLGQAAAEAPRPRLSLAGGLAGIRPAALAARARTTNN